MRLLYRGKERNTSHRSFSVSYSPVSFSPNSRAVSATTASYPVSAANEENCAALSRRGMGGCYVGNMVRQGDNIIVVVAFLALHARCPPICLFRSRVVAPSSRFMPFSMALLP